MKNQSKIIWHAIGKNPHPKLTRLPNELVLCTNNLHGSLEDGTMSNVYLATLKLVPKKGIIMKGTQVYTVGAFSPENARCDYMSNVTYWAYAPPIMKLKYCGQLVDDLKLYGTAAGEYYSYSH